MGSVIRARGLAGVIALAVGALIAVQFPPSFAPPPRSLSLPFSPVCKGGKKSDSAKGCEVEKSI